MVLTHLKNTATVARMLFLESAESIGSMSTLEPAAGVNGTPTSNFG